MQHPEFLYYAALALLVAPSMAFNRLAIVVALAWVVGQWGYLLHLPSALLDFGVDIIAFGACAGLQRGRADRIVAAVYLPMIATNAGRALGYVPASEAYWSIYWLAMFQAFTVPFGNNLATFKDGCRALADMSWLDKLLRTKAT